MQGFIDEIKAELIIGWIVADEHMNELKNKMVTGEMKKREVWSVKIFETFNFDMEHRSRYGFFTSDVNMYLENINSDGIYVIPSKEHLKNIPYELIPNDINWNGQGNILQNEIKLLWDKNNDKIVWNSKEVRYKWR